MIVARWSIDAKFGHKPAVIDSLSKWQNIFGAQIGWEGKCRILTGSVGALESTVISEITLDNLAELSESWDKLAELDGHKQWSIELEPHIVSGTMKWDVYRIVE
ncbi:conserved hypothetical protein [Shewanella sediminis HAW-EB3]|uniref:Uncharacterized protein n=1 Tax=Shewanella sediminis (strain HAW-EB3) TaxID=425104 RepID=A8FTB8_SHESH|nr:hypothetical protein [Shewanella sediminis]ABV36091.1 conserved hypothetical protein [Shewanella sediminis HAW-EB3]